MSVRNASPSIYYGNIDAQNWSLVSVNTGQTKTSKNAVASHAVTTTTIGSAITIVESPATSWILRVSASLTTLSALWIAHRVARRATSHRISSIRFYTTKDVQ